jgi:hypothetical protein
VPIIVPLTTGGQSPDQILNTGAYGAGAVIRLQWSATSTGTFADVSGTGSTPTIAVETDKRSYTGYDPVGTTGSTWYRTRFENTGATRVSDWSAAFQIGVTGGLYPDYVSLDETRTFLRITDVDDIEADLQLALAITAASRAVDRATDRQFGLLTTAAARYYRPVWSDQHGRWLAHIDDLMSSTSLVVKSDTDDNATYETTITDYRLWPLNAASDGKPWREIVFGTATSIGTREGSLEVTALWGWSSVPATVKNATLIQASRFYKRRESPYGVAGSPDMGNELRLLAKVDPDVAVMLMPYRAWSMV